MYNKILIPLERSDVDETVLAQAAEQASGTDAEVVLLVVLSEAGVLPTKAHREYNEARQYLDAMVHKLELRGVRASAAMRYGKPAEEIVDYAQTHGMDLMAMSTHGRSGLGRWVFGRLTEKVMRGVPLPVLLVRA